SRTVIEVGVGLVNIWSRPCSSRAVLLPTAASGRRPWLMKARCQGRRAFFLRGSGKDDRSIAVDQDTALEVQSNGACQHETFEVGADPFQVGDGVAVADRCRVLSDDRSLVEFGGDVVGGGAD